MCTGSQFQPIGISMKHVNFFTRTIQGRGAVKLLLPVAQVIYDSRYFIGQAGEDPRAT
jgi:hypothetical protein